MPEHADSVAIRPARIEDLPRRTEIRNHYTVNTPTTFDLEPFTVEQRRTWFEREVGRTFGQYGDVVWYARPFGD